MKNHTILTALVMLAAAVAHPARAEFTRHGGQAHAKGELTHFNGVALPPIQTAAQARAETEKRLAAIKAAEAKVAAQASVNPPSAISNPQLFYTGKPYLEETGQYVFLFRHYDPELGRWTTSDPSGFPDGANNAVYTRRPTTHLDPLGLAEYSTQLFWHWLTGGGSTVVLPWSAFDPSNAAPTFAGSVWRSHNLGLLNQLGQNASFGVSSAAPETTPASVPFSNPAEPVLSSFTVFGLLAGSISINKSWEGSRWRADLSWTLAISALDIFDFNPGDNFGPYGFLQDDWFLAFQQLTDIPVDFAVIGSAEHSGSYTVFE